MPTAEEASRLLALAQGAHARGDALLQLQLDVGLLTGERSTWGSAGNTMAGDESTGYFLGEVEKLGWRLEHTGFTFVESGATTSARMFGTGEGVVNHGAVVGYYVFRRA
ncbi:hypothetical protein [Microbacterium sp. AK031]|uniref:hypothetical protein n=1 Tax=Microbacterium sp. AK031 TaxID=2723076 RepID=UPI00216911A6|nr:hypothetical protein [Microbacterium sp. AK031]MCS3844654.1 hypothetical protein [Microbacterium sp. AK031]